MRRCERSRRGLRPLSTWQPAQIVNACGRSRAFPISTSARPCRPGSAGRPAALRRAGHAGCRADCCGAFLDDSRHGHLRHARRWRAGARRIGKNVQVGQVSSPRPGAAACSRTCASLSVGKPAIRSAPNTTSGRMRAGPRATTRCRVGRGKCRRFMRLRIRSSPALQRKVQLRA